MRRWQLVSEHLLGTICFAENISSPPTTSSNIGRQGRVAEEDSIANMPQTGVVNKRILAKQQNAKYSSSTLEMSAFILQSFETLSTLIVVV